MSEPTSEPAYSSDDELEQALEAAGVGVWIFDLADDRVRWSPQMGKMFGLQPEAFPATYAAYAAILPEVGRARVVAAVGAAVERAGREQCEVPFSVEHEAVLPDGSMRWLECTGRVRLDAEGRVRRLIGTSIDATARHTAELAQQAREEQYRLFTELASDYIYQADRLTWLPSVVAGSFERIARMTLADVAARGGWLEIVHPDDRAYLQAQGARVSAGESVVSEYRIIDGVGQVRWLRDTTRPLLDASGKLTDIVGGVQEITDQRRLSDALAHARKLEAIARLAGGVAHDFNNLLSIMFSALALLRRHLPDKPVVSELYGDLSDATQRAATLTRSLLTFSRRDEPVSTYVAIDELFTALSPVLARLLPVNVHFATHHQGGPAWLRIDREQIERAMVNLVSNARDAMPEGGQLVVSSDVVTLAARDPRLPPGREPGPYVIIEIRDTGIGMDERTLEHLFEPFFTTKPSGHGTGLGMAIAHGAVQQAGGAIHVDSQPGAGTTVRVALPVSTSPPQRPANSPPPAPTLGSELLLYVEDEPAVQRMTVQLLRERGYQVLAFGSAEDALRADPALLARVRLLVTDETLPGRPGSHLAANLHERFSIPALVVSGFLTADVSQTLQRRGVRVLGKPHGADELARTIREILDARPEAAAP